MVHRPISPGKLTSKSRWGAVGLLSRYDHDGALIDQALRHSPGSAPVGVRLIRADERISACDGLPTQLTQTPYPLDDFELSRRPVTLPRLAFL